MYIGIEWNNSMDEFDGCHPAKFLHTLCMRHATLALRRNQFIYCTFEVQAETRSYYPFHSLRVWFERSITRGRSFSQRRCYFFVYILVSVWVWLAQDRFFSTWPAPSTLKRSRHWMVTSLRKMFATFWRSMRTDDFACSLQRGRSTLIVSNCAIGTPARGVKEIEVCYD